MKKQNPIIAVLIAFLLFIGSCTTVCDCNTDPYIDYVSEYDVLKTLIQTNCTNFATGFETVFEENPEFKGPNSDSTAYAELCQAVINPVRYFLGETGYFFVESHDAWMVAHATNQDLVGTYRYDVQDINGKYYVRDMVNAIEYTGYGFVEYYFEHPDTGVSTKKISFVKDIPNAEFFIGSGFYNYYEDNYLSREEVALSLVENLTKSMAEGLAGGMETFTDSLDKVNFCRQFIDKIRFFDNQSGYFFVYDSRCVNVAHGTQKDLEGKNLYNYQDSQGNYVIQGLRNVVATNGHGYYDYYWNNPVSGEEEPKRAYVFKVPGMNYFIGSGVYY